MSAEDITGFFAVSRKAKDIETKKVKETVRVITPSIEEKSIELKADLVEKKDEVMSSERYQAIPKKKLERKFDKFMKKSIQINEDDFMFLSNLERQISFARKKSTLKKDGLNRVTSNTIIRLLIEQFCAKAEFSLDSNLLSALQTEEEIINWIKEM